MRFVRSGFGERGSLPRLVQLPKKSLVGLPARLLSLANARLPAGFRSASRGESHKAGLARTREKTAGLQRQMSCRSGRGSCAAPRVCTARDEVGAGVTSSIQSGSQPNVHRLPRTAGGGRSAMISTDHSGTRALNGGYSSAALVLRLRGAADMGRHPS